MTSTHDLIQILSSYRLPLSDEKELQAEIAKVFENHRLAFEREVRLSNKDVIDFKVGSIGIEVKIGGAKRAIWRQCSRYCAHDDIKTLILLTNVPVGLPEEIEGATVHLVQLGRAWL